jgi:uncharacterized protein YggE
MRTSSYILSLTLAASCLAPPSLFAQESATVAASGTQVIERLPTQLALQIELIGRGKTLKEALAKLDRRKQAAGLLLKSLGAEMDTVKYGDPTTSNASSASQQQLQAMIRERIGRSGGETPEGLKLPESVTASLALSARWKLSSDKPSELLEQATQLCKKIEDADLGGLKDGDDASLAEQELIEEAEAYGGYDRYSGEQAVKPGTPNFSYVATITPEERQAAMKSAFEAAQRDAEELAAAAGRELGNLVTLESHAMSQSPYEEEYYGYAAAYRRQMMLGAANDRLSTQGAELGKLNFTFVVQAKFQLKP